MLTKAGLYYPYIHFRDDTWMKAAALYWPAMARIVPHGYPTRDSPTITALSRELDFVQNLRPGVAVQRTGMLFLELLRMHGDQLRSVAGVRRGYVSREELISEWRTRDSGRSRIGFIYAEKITSALRDELISLGLATFDRSLGENHRFSAGPDPSRWIGLDARLAAVYMCVLADEIAHDNYLTPVTDQEIAQAAVGGWTIDKVASILLNVELTADRLERPNQDAQGADLTSRMALLALDITLPSCLKAVPVDKIIDFRRKHSAEITQFSEAVSSATAEVAELDLGIDDKILDMYVKDILEKHFFTPRDELEKSMKSAKLDTILSTLTVQIPLPVVTALGTIGIGAAPILGVGAGVAVGVASISMGAKKRRQDLRQAAPAADYMLAMKRELRPDTSILRTLKRIRMH